MNLKDKLFWSGILISSISIIWGLFIDFIGGKIWLIGYWLMLAGWILAIVKSKQKKKWRLWQWSLQICLFFIAFILDIDRAITFTLWWIKGFAP